MDKAILDDYAERGLLRRQRHPSRPLTIYNYSSTAAYSKAWDEVTLNCRGLVVDDSGTVVMRPFSKFFNLEEVETLPDGPFTATEKLDGSLILATWNGEWLVASRGSFTSEQAAWGAALIEKMPCGGVIVGVTYIFELIHPQNRIVVSYGNREELVLLGAIFTETGEEVARALWPAGWSHVREAEGDWTPDTLKALNVENQEGYVLRFGNGERIKVKFEEYIRLHRIVTGVSSKTVWEYLRDDKPFEELLSRVPDEFNAWVRAKEEEYRQKVGEILTVVRRAVESVLGLASRKDQAVALTSGLEDKALAPICFNLLDGRHEDARRNAYKRIEPKYEQPFAARGEA